MENKIDFIGATFMSIILYLFGKIDTSLIVLFIIIGIDYITGIIKAYLTKKLNSKTGFKGFLKKLLMIMIVSFGCLLDKVTGTDGLLRNFVIYYYIVNEGLSILENVSACGVKLPDKLKIALEQLEER